MSNPATFDQAYQLLSVAREAGISLENLQAHYRAGLLSDLLKVEDPESVDREAFQRLLGLVFRVTMGAAETTDEIVQYLREQGFGYVNDWITQENFPLQPRETPQDDEIVIVDPGTSFTLDEGLVILAKEELMRPIYEHALRFARRHGTATSSKKKPFVVFPHEPWQDPIRDGRVLCVHRDPERRELFLFFTDDGFGTRCVLAGVRRK